MLTTGNDVSSSAEPVLAGFPLWVLILADRDRLRGLHRIIVLHRSKNDWRASPGFLLCSRCCGLFLHHICAPFLSVLKILLISILHLFVVCLFPCHKPLLSAIMPPSRVFESRSVALGVSVYMYSSCVVPLVCLHFESPQGLRCGNMGV